ncbi:VLRF1 family aeRF1-type release factor [Halalkalibacter nanhaiisediminis]|uniref:Protein required for attachment to host cells n=1 Tax=Halalkalibacter nanhaiisediminis TaxID=688079 RepID=A0A562QA04_9BACI|nr:VLRF1 family aeRF1-type release factor [Halalkalibacter nanhaiisediminis]TWI53591.1 hypothetical protein IQ10_03319 [Halalkalibacter nanhaiisediminis]
MVLKKELQKLQTQICKEGYLTIYLNTDQSSGDQQKGEWKIRLKNGLKKLEEYIEVSEKENINAYKKLKKRVTSEIHDLQADMPKSVLVIASADGDWLLEKLQIRVENEFHWEKQPILEQLEKLQRKFPKSGILLVQKRDLSIIETSLGEVLEQLSYQWDLENEDWKQYEGVAATERVASGANHRDQFEQRFEANQQRWYKQLASVIQKKAKNKGWQKIYLVGPPELINEFEKYLTYDEIDKIKKNFNDLKPHEIVNDVVAS